MDEMIDELTEIAEKCNAVHAQIESGPLNELVTNVIDATAEVGKSSANSWIGQDSHAYLEGFRPRTNERSIEESRRFGVDAGWRLYTYEAVESEILKRAKVRKRELENLTKAANVATKVFKESKSHLLSTLKAIGSIYDDEHIQEMLVSLNKLTPFLSRSDLVANEMPNQMMTFSPFGITDGIRAPHHICFKAYIEEQFSCFTMTGEVGDIARTAATYLKQRSRLQNARGSATMSTTKHKIFIGHGRDQVWRDLKDYLQDHLKLEVDEFNMEATAGMPIVNRLQGMLDNAKFALLIMTAEDEQADGTLRTRENVVHEVGLFQGRLGFNKAIVLLENGCKEFSNIHGLGQIRFDRGNLQAQFHEVHRVLKREGIVP